MPPGWSGAELRHLPQGLRDNAIAQPGRASGAGATQLPPGSLPLAPAGGGAGPGRAGGSGRSSGGGRAV